MANEDEMAGRKIDGAIDGAKHQPKGWSARSSDGPRLQRAVCGSRTSGDLARTSLPGAKNDFAARAKALRRRLRSSVDSSDTHTGRTGRCAMITSLRLVDFKNFADETLRIGPFTVIVGANASGKSNIRDAFRVSSTASAATIRWRRSVGGKLRSRRRAGRMGYDPWLRRTRSSEFAGILGGSSRHPHRRRFLGSVSMSN